MDRTKDDDWKALLREVGRGSQEKDIMDLGWNEKVDDTTKI